MKNAPSQKIFEAVGALAQALGSAARLKILHLLSQAPRSVESISTATGESIANTSQHLQRLLQQGLVAVKKEKLSRIYGLRDPATALLIERLFDLAEQSSPELLNLEAKIAATATLGPVVSVLNIQKDLEQKTAILLDVREELEAKHSPVKDALRIPLAHLSQQSQALSKNITYYVLCRGRACALASQGVELLRSLGFSAHRLKEGPSTVHIPKE